MAGSTRTEPTVDETIALLARTSLPTLICEGSDDLIVYRRIEDRLSHLGVSVLPVGGRLNVLEIFDRRGEIASRVQLGFIADKDTWVNSGVPAQYTHAELILTDGYSIENDVFRDGNLMNLLVGAELARFRRELDQFVEWYALALSRHLAGASFPIARHPEQVLDPAQRPALLALNRGEAYPAALKAALLADYQKLVRGKSLVALLIRNTNSRPGQPRHNDKGLLESVAARPGPLLTQITAKASVLMGARE